MNKNNVDLKWMDNEHNAKYFEHCKTKHDVIKVLRKQVELEIPTGLSRAARSLAIKIRDKVVDWQMMMWVRPNPSSFTKSVDLFVDSIHNIGGCNLFSHPKENIVDCGKNGLLNVVFDGGLGYDLFSYSGGLERDWLFETVDADDRIMFEDYASWALTIYPW